ncbi:MAG TPA: hypothetical protein VMH50_13815 [Thermoleophilia bacterium]|nr:hypothetical protein [Thermoleophilia bacterium]
MRRTIALGLVAAVAILAAAALPGCGCQKQAVEATSGNIDIAKDAAVKTQLMMIKTGIQAYIASNGSAPPDATQATLGSFVAPWPTNPFDKAPMKPGDAAGDYIYTPGGGTAFTLAVHLSDGTTSTAP